MANFDGVYWIGANGKTYINVAGIAGGPQEWHAPLLSPQQMGLRQIDDPNPPKQGPSAPPSNPNGGGGGGGAAPKPDKSNDIALQNAGLAAVDAQERSGLSAIDQALGVVQGRYAADAAKAEGDYTTNSTTNNQNFQKNNQTALVNAAQGRQGLFGSLAAIGALNGSGIDLANRAVTKGANDDLAGSADSFNTNQTTLDKAIDAFRTDNERRKEDANTAAVNARTNVKNQVAQNRLGFYQNLINDYAAMGDDANAKKFTGLASGLYPSLAATSVPNATIAYSDTAKFAPGAMQDYLAGNESTQVSATPTAPGQTIPGLIASSPTVKKKQLLTV